MFYDKNRYLLAIAVCFCSSLIGDLTPDLTVVGSIKFADGLARLPITLIDMLKQDLKINFIHSKLVPIDFKDVPESVKTIVNTPNKIPGKVALIFEQLWVRHGSPYEALPDSSLKIAISMIESTAIPKKWVNILNSKFDLVAVPDEFLIEVYEQSGVKIPIFTMGLPLYLNEFLTQPLKSKANNIFTFGYSGRFVPEKNYALLAKAFSKEFKNNQRVQLLIHGRGGEIDPEVKKLTTKYKNIKIKQKSFSNREYLAFMSSLDCYAIISKGEGFSTTPREAMALGLPCILSNNTAHASICRTGLVEAVNCNLRERAYYSVFGFDCGEKFNCLLSDVRQALRRVYDNYSAYLRNAAERRRWASHYHYSNLKSYYLALIKPKTVILGEHNYIGDGYLVTNSPVLHAKYQKIVNGLGRINYKSSYE